ncbi:nitrate reductase molybdenum cofactor assembly chaperone [Desulfosarcina sp.]|uniref:nitrate reductase molybdenum cofactor assembly chaperone n=1 Tax=Desulfosarcina sp. TaxID=2027861 RepID=UPI0039710296
MTGHPTDSLHVLSVLLHYPDEDLLNSLDEIESSVTNWPLSETKAAIQAFVSELKTLNPIHAQERYTALFDIDPAATLNMTYHAYGENEKRAAALANLQHNYEQAGWERITGELPDYLPMLLEFLSICPHPEHTGPVWQCLQGLQPLVARLEKNAPVYAALLQPIVRMAVKHCPSVDNGDHPPGANA